MVMSSGEKREFVSTEEREYGERGDTQRMTKKTATKRTAAEIVAARTSIRRRTISRERSLNTITPYLGDNSMQTYLKIRMYVYNGEFDEISKAGYFCSI